MQTVDVNEFLRLASEQPVVDVRSPGEYRQGHMPGAVNLPLFDDSERAAVGTLYKKTGRTEAFDLGLDLVGPKMSEFVREARKLAPGRRILVHCWRGGMRSASMAWLFETAGFRVTLLRGGYKSYRAHIRENLTAGRKFIILGGFTGSGKTVWLGKLAASGEAVIDLERLANHRGSVFGGIGLGEQPTNEQFENELFAELQRIPAGTPVWLEDESRQIGRIFMPEPLYDAMTEAPMIRMEVPAEERVRVILDEYAGLDREQLASAIQQISKRLGGLVTSQCLELLNKDDYGEVVRLLLPYYDRTYSHSTERRERKRIYPMDPELWDPGQYHLRLIEKKSEIMQ